MITLLQVGPLHLNLGLITAINTAAMHGGVPGISVRFDESNWKFFADGTPEATALNAWLAGHAPKRQITLQGSKLQITVLS